MKRTLKIEEIGLLAGSIVVFTQLGFAWWWFPLLLLTPDVAMVGYLAGPAWGSRVYNFFHHRAVAAVVGVTAFASGAAWLGLVAVILFAHISMDRALGYGLKYPDDFRHTHLGWIGGGDDRSEGVEDDGT